MAQIAGGENFSGPQINATPHTLTSREAPEWRRAMEAAANKDKRNDVIAKNPEQAARLRQEQTAEIGPTAQKTYAEVMTTSYLALVDVAGQDINNLSEWQKNILTIVQEEYKSKRSNSDITKASPEELTAFMQEMIQNNDKFKIIGLKLSEWQYVTLKAATNAENDIPSLPDEQKYITTYQNIGVDGVEPARRENTGGGQISGWLKRRYAHFRPMLKRDGSWADPLRGIFTKSEPANRAARRAVSEEKRVFEREGQKRIDMIKGVRFEDNAKLNLQVQIEKPGALLPDDVAGPALPPDGLDAASEAFLRRLHQVGTIRDGDRLTVAAKQEVANLMGRITELRVQAYKTMGRQIDHDRASIEMVENSGGFMQYTVSTADIPAVALDRFGLQGGEMQIGAGIVGVGTQLDDIVRRMMPEYDAQINKKIQDTDVKRTQDIIASKIDELRQGEQIVYTEAEQKRLTELSTQIQEKETALQERNELSEVPKKQAEIQSKLDAARARLDPEYAALIDATDPNSVKGLENAIETLTTSEEDEKFTKTRLEHDVAMAKEAWQAEQASYNTALQAQSKGGKGVIDIDKIKEGVDRAKEAYLRASEALRAKAEEIEQIQRQIKKKGNALTKAKSKKENYESQHEGEITSFQQYEAELKNMQRRVRELESRYGVTAGTRTGIEDIQNEINHLKNERATVERKPSLLRQHQREVYEIMEEIVTEAEMTNIINRATNMGERDMRAHLNAAREAYPGYTQEYLQTIIVLFGPEATVPTQAGKKEFQRARKLLPVDAFNDYFTAYTPGRVDNEFIMTVMEDLMERSRDGRLGQLKRIDEAALRQLQDTEVVQGVNDFESILKRDDKSIEQRNQQYVVAELINNTPAALASIPHPHISELVSLLSTDRNAKKTQADSEARIISHLAAAGTTITPVEATAIYTAISETNIRVNTIENTIETAARKNIPEDDAYIQSIIGRNLSIQDKAALYGALAAVVDTANAQRIMQGVQNGEAIDTILSSIDTTFDAEVSAILYEIAANPTDSPQVSIQNALVGVSPTIAAEFVNLNMGVLTKDRRQKLLEDAEDRFSTIDSVDELALEIIQYARFRPAQYQMAKVYAQNILERRKKRS